jgi:hypothetical protein
MEFQGLKPAFFEVLYVAAEAATHKDLPDYQFNGPKVRARMQVVTVTSHQSRITSH